MNQKKFLRYVTGHGCLFARHGSGHDIWRNEKTGGKTSIPRHKELEPDTIKAICKQLGVPPPPEK